MALELFERDLFFIANAARQPPPWTFRAPGMCVLWRKEMHETKSFFDWFFAVVALDLKAYLVSPYKASGQPGSAFQAKHLFVAFACVWSHPIMRHCTYVDPYRTKSRPNQLWMKCIFVTNMLCSNRTYALNGAITIWRRSNMKRIRVWSIYAVQYDNWW